MSNALRHWSVPALVYLAKFILYASQMTMTVLNFGNSGFAACSRFVVSAESLTRACNPA